MKGSIAMTLAAALLCAAAAGAASAQSGYHRSRPAPKEGFSYPECYCTNRGERVELGELSCLRVGGRRFTARCDMSLNNPTWRRVRDGCAPDGLSLAPDAPARPATPRAAPG